MSQMSQSFISILSMLQDMDTTINPTMFTSDSVECPIVFRGDTLSENTQTEMFESNHDASQNQFTVLTDVLSSNNNVNLPNNVTVSPSPMAHNNLQQIPLVVKESMTDHWDNELKNHWYTIEEQTIISLEMIKRDRIRKGLPFDEKFKADFLHAANTILCDTFEQFTMENPFISNSFVNTNQSQPQVNWQTNQANAESGCSRSIGVEDTFAHRQSQSSTAAFDLPNINQNQSSTIVHTNSHSEHFESLNTQRANCRQPMPYAGNELNVLYSSEVNTKQNTKENMINNDSFEPQLTNANTENLHNNQRIQYTETIDLISDDELEEKPEIGENGAIVSK